VPNESRANTNITAMLSEVETAHVVTCKAVPRDSSRPLGMTIFAMLDVYHDHALHSAAMNMAIDEALLDSIAVSSIRFYRWKSPALSFGYFGKFGDVASYAYGRDLVRRWTGGGVVFHGDDLTYAIAIPANAPIFGESSGSIYVTIHAALRNALAAIGKCAELAPAAGVVDAGSPIPGRGNSCFANPVRSDVILKGRKIAGAAQRRTRRGLLQQGSIQYIDLETGFPLGFARELSENRSERKIDNELLDRAKEIAEKKYSTEAWLRKR